jgi:hypothetical protein
MKCDSALFGTPTVLEDDPRFVDGDEIDSDFHRENVWILRDQVAHTIRSRVVKDTIRALAGRQ